MPHELMNKNFADVNKVPARNSDGKWLMRKPNWYVPESTRRLNATAALTSKWWDKTFFASPETAPDVMEVDTG